MHTLYIIILVKVRNREGEREREERVKRMNSNKLINERKPLILSRDCSMTAVGLKSIYKIYFEKGLSL